MKTSLKKQIEIANKLLKEKYVSLDNPRYLHILGVAKMAKSLAAKYNACEEKAYLAGLMHDYYKYEKHEEMALLLNEEELLECKKCDILYHSYASAEAYLKLVGDDTDIYNAIKNHVFGRCNMSKLEEIILISDYVEETREYPSCVYCRGLVLKGLFYTAIYESTRLTIKHLEAKNIKPHPMQYDILKIYKEKMIMELVDILKTAIDKVKAFDVTCYDLRNQSPFYDYMLVASVQSLRQASAVAGYVEELTKDTPFKIRSIEGENTEWVLIDCYDAVLQIFTDAERKRIALDKIYMDYPVVENK